MSELERLVREWREAQKYIDELHESGKDRSAAMRMAALNRMIAAHNALAKYVDEEMGI